MKKLLALILSLLLCLPCIPARADETLTIVHATDMHFLSPALTDYGESFMEIIEGADGKVTHYTPQIMQAFVDEMLMLLPDAIILSGDLTLNGAKQSHTDLIKILQPLTEAGIQVLALPGNHDTNTAGYQFTGDQVTLVDGIEDADFDDMYAAFGYDDALSRDTASMSYVAELSPKVWCLLVDVNANGTSGTALDETLLWMEAQLARAQREGITVIAVSHHPAIVHNGMFTFGYVVSNNTKLLVLYKEYDVPLSLCGHLHMQHITSSHDTLEIAASSLAVAPNQYGILTANGNQLIAYETKPLDVAGWATRTGQDDPNLLNFAAYSSEFFNRNTYGSVQAMLAGSSISAEEQQLLTDFVVTLNAQYFAGKRTITAEDPAWALWQKYFTGSFFTEYIDSMLCERARDMCTVTFLPARSKAAIIPSACRIEEGARRKLALPALTPSLSKRY